MSIEKIAVSHRQLALFALLFLAPLAFALLIPSTSPDNSDLAAAWIAGTVCTGLAALVLGAMLSRRIVQLSDDALLIKHTFYTFRIGRAEVKRVTVDRLDSLHQLGVSTKKNGVAAFGFWSGWFHGPGGAPIFRFRFEGARQAQLALSCTPKMAAAIQTRDARP